MPRTSAARAARDDAIRASSSAIGVLAARYGLSGAQVSRIRSSTPRVRTKRERFELEVVAGGWAAVCMEPDEWADWVRDNPRSLKGAEFAHRPCVDCPLGFAAEMRAIGRCNGSPGAVGGRHEPDDEEGEGPAMLNQARPPAVERLPVERAIERGKRSPEARERMRVAQLASWERRRAGKAEVSGPPPVAEAKPSRPAGDTRVPEPAVTHEAVAPAEERAAVTLPCGGCSHAVVCAIKPVLEHDFPTNIVGPHPAIHLEVRCDHFLAATS